jgi:hypothetical protein
MLRAREIGIAVMVVAMGGCGDYRFRGGLASVPSINRPWTDEDFAHDVIANGDQSCPRSGRSEEDRLFRRFPPCGGWKLEELRRMRRPPPPPPPAPTQGLPPLAPRGPL